MIRALSLGLAIGMLVAAAYVVQFVATAPSLARLDEVRAEHARLIAAHGTIDERLRDLRVAPRENVIPAELVWTQSARSDAEFAVQGLTLEVAAAHGLVPSSYGPSAVPSDIQSSAAGFQVEATGTWSSVLKFLQGMRDVSPRLSISEVSIRTAPPSLLDPPEAQVSIRLVFWGFAPEIEVSP